MGRPRLTIRTQTHNLDVSIENHGVRREMETMEETNEKYDQSQTGRETTPKVRNQPKTGKGSLFFEFGARTERSAAQRRWVSEWAAAANESPLAARSQHVEVGLLEQVVGKEVVVGGSRRMSRL